VFYGKWKMTSSAADLELVVVVSENKTQRYFARLGINELSHV